MRTALTIFPTGILSNQFTELLPRAADSERRARILQNRLFGRIRPFVHFPHPRTTAYCNSDGRFAQIASSQYCSMAWPTLLDCRLRELRRNPDDLRSGNHHRIGVSILFHGNQEGPADVWPGDIE